MATHIPAVTKFSSKIIRILGCNPGTMTLQGTNTYLLGSGNKRILLDTGESDKPEYIDHLKQVLSAESARLEHIIISHWHHDHIGGVQDIFKYLSPNNCKVWKYKRTDGDEPNTGGIQVNELHKNQKFFTEGATLKVVHTPGHTTDHIILNLEEENALFSGDCILGETTAVFEDLHSYILSLQKILSLNPSVIYPGHGPVVNSPMEKIRYYIEHRNKREQEILSALNDTTNENKTQWSEMELVKKIYKDTPEHLHVPASINVNHHLKKLLKEGKVIHVDNKWSIRSNL